jgi:small-conductance mechanosensitive channel
MSSDLEEKDSVRVSITTPSRPPIPPSSQRPYPPAGTTPHIPSNLPLITGGDAPDEFGDDGRNDEDDGAEDSDRVSDLLAAEKSTNNNYNEHVGISSPRSSSDGNNDGLSESSSSVHQDHVVKKERSGSLGDANATPSTTKQGTSHAGGESEQVHTSSRTPSLSLAQAMAASSYIEGPTHQGWVLKQPSSSQQHISLSLNSSSEGDATQSGGGVGVLPHGIATYRDRSASSAFALSRVNSMSFRHLPHLPSASSSSASIASYNNNNNNSLAAGSTIEPLTANSSVGSFGGQGVALTGFPRRDENEIYYASKLVDSESALMEASRNDLSTTSFIGSGHRFSTPTSGIIPIQSPLQSPLPPTLPQSSSSSSTSSSSSSSNASSSTSEHHSMIDRSGGDPTSIPGSSSSSSSSSSTSPPPRQIPPSSDTHGRGDHTVNNFAVRPSGGGEGSFYGGSLLKAHIFSLIFNYRNYRVYLTAFAAILGLFFRLLFPAVSFWNNEAYKWLWFTSALIGASYLLHGAEMLIFYLLKMYAGERENAYASHFKSYAALALVMVLALVMRVPAFQIVLSDAGTFYFNAAVVYILVFLCALILKNVLLHQIVLKLVFESRHRTPVLDCIFFLRLCRLITAPLSSISPTIEDELDDALARTSEPLSARSAASGVTATVTATVKNPPQSAVNDNPPLSAFAVESLVRRAFFLVRPSLSAKRNEMFALEATFLREEDDFWHMRNTVLRSRLSAFIDDGYEVDIISARGAEELAVMAFKRLSERKSKLKRIGRKAELVLERLNGRFTTATIAAEVAAIESQSSDGTRESLSLDDVACCFETRADLKHAFSVLDMDSNGKVGCEELVASFRSMYMGWSSTQVQLKSYGAVSNAIRWLAETAWWIVMLILLIIIFDVQASNFIIGAGTFFLSISFAIGPTLQRLLDSLIFVLLVRPYDVADIVQISGVYSNAPHRITQVNVLTTEMENVLSHKRVMARNADIITFNITNLRHSTNACVQPQFSVDHSLTGEMFNTLVAKVKAYLLANSFDWKPEVQCNVEHADSNKVLLTFRCTHNSSWQEQNKVNRAYSLLVLEITRLFEEMQLSFMSPTRRFEIVPGFHGDTVLPETILEEDGDEDEDGYDNDVEIPSVSVISSETEPLQAALSKGVAGKSARRRKNVKA